MDRKLILDVAKQMRKLADSIEALTKEEDVKASESEEKVISLEDVRAVLAKISQHGLAGEVKKLIKKYGGTKLSDVDPDNYQKLLDDVKEIKVE